MKKRFDSITPALINQRKAVHELCRQFTRSPSKGNLKRLKTLFSACGDNVFIEYGFHMDYGDTISIGDRTFINTHCTIIDGTNMGEANINGANINGMNLDNEKITQGKSIINIGVDCFIGPNVQLLAVSHDIAPNARLTKHNYVNDIIIGNNVWLGGGVIVLAGVRIGNNSVVGAGSVVTKSLSANGFYAGNPAVKIRDL